MQPLLLRMLQHPQERLRHTAARALSATYMQTRHPEVLVSLLSCKEDVLGLLLKLLAGEDEEDSRCKYAILLGLLSTRTDAAGCKRIADAGAVPYVLQLLKQTDMESVKIDCVRCLVVRSPDTDTFTPNTAKSHVLALHSASIEINMQNQSAECVRVTYDFVCAPLSVSYFLLTL